jgi:hypothetical protein
MDQSEMMMRPVGGFSPYEQMKLQNMQARSHTSGLAIGGLVTAVGAAVAAIGVGFFANTKANGVKNTAAAKNDGLKDLVQTLAGTLAAERNERLQQGLTISQTINDTISGQQSAAQSSQVSQTSAIDTSVQQIMTQTFADAITGKSSLNPTPVMIYSAPQPCACPGCGCNG